MISRIGKLIVETAGAPRLDAAQALRAKTVALLVDDNCDILLARSALALSLRCFTGVTIVRPAHGRIVPHRIANALRDEASEYGAQNRLSIDGLADATLGLGLGCAAGDCFVDPRNWSVSVNERGVPRAPVAPPAAAFAAAAGVAKLFGTLVGRDVSVQRERWTAPMLDFASEAPHGDTVIALGRILLIGAGAIGSGLAHVLRGSSWQANVTLVDRERYDEPNHETTLVVSKDTTMRQAPKATALAAPLRSSVLTVDAIQDEVVAGHRFLGEPVDAVVCAVDNAELRRHLDNTAARVVFNAGVGGASDDAGMVLWTRHRPNEVPLSAHYPLREEGASNAVRGPEDVVTDECSRISYANVSLAAPFMGLAAGALLAAGLAQEALGFHAPSNYVKFDMLGCQKWSTRKVLRRVAPL